MSRFFQRSDSSSSSSSGEDDNVELALVQDRKPQKIQHEAQSQANHVNTATASLSPTTSTNHRDLLLHALLEERCLRQAQDEFNEGPQSDRVRNSAQQQYEVLAEQLAAYGLVAPDLHKTRFSSQRERYRNGLDIVSQQLRQPDNGAVRLGSQFMIENGDDLLPAVGGAGELSSLNQQRSPVLDMRMVDRFALPNHEDTSILSMRGLSNALISPTSWSQRTRYEREFEEISTLGKGGYGVVYHCKHRLDGLPYAVKKVPLSMSRMQSIQDRGQDAVNEMLLELTTLARLDHPNVVRYFGGWVEWAVLNDDSPITSAGSRNVSVSHTERRFVSTESQHSIITTDDSFITFERSQSAGATMISFDRSDRSTRNDILFEHSTSKSKSASSRGSQHSHDLERQSTRDTRATVTDDDVESISRVSDRQELSTLSTRLSSSTPCLALHIQMGLYPQTLSDHLAPSVATPESHCFHLEPTIRILQALCEGVSYLHSQGVAHRDLKPANIFMSSPVNSTTTHCRRCTNAGLLNNQNRKVRIGDFGLVAELARHGSEAISPVGTDLYRLDSASTHAKLEALDWFALGIIAFELIWPFSTRMERHQTLSALKAGMYPHDFSRQCSGCVEEVTDLLEYLLRDSAEVDADIVQQKLGSLLEREMKR
ncbi:hypothetical protein MRB53_041667 [Persea americana]|nr:hypothetical protein MRB53_041667 [Persea americana]